MIDYEPEIDDIFANLQKTSVKRKRNSARKGKNAERLICKMFETRFGMSFVRSPESGGFATRNESKFSDLASGDIVVPENFRFVIESKCGYDIDLVNLFKPQSGDAKLFNKFLDQVSREAETSGRSPMLIYRKDNRTPLVVVLEILHGYDVVLSYKYMGNIWRVYSLNDVLREDDDFFLRNV